VGTRCADHVTPLYPQKLALTSPTGGSRSVGIVRVRTKATEYVAQYVTLKLPVFVIQFSIFSSICCGSVIWRYVLVLNLCGRLGERPLLWGAGSEIWHWLHQVFLVTLLVIWLIQRYENCQRNIDTDQKHFATGDVSTVLLLKTQVSYGMWRRVHWCPFTSSYGVT